MSAGAAPADEVADLVVVGAGMAGFCCAIEAAQRGMHVTLLEKEADVGGSSALSGGSFAFAGTDQQRAAGIDDSTELMLQDLRNVGGHRNNEALLRTFGAEQLATYRWLQAIGFVFGPPKAAAGQSVPRTHRMDPHEAFVQLGKAAEHSGRIRLCRGIGATRLLRGHDGAGVFGVLADAAGRPVRIEARRGVVLTTGGFMRSEALMTTFAPGQAAALRMGSAGCTGDGLRMAWQLGADLCDMGYIKGTFGIHPSARPEDHFFLHSVYMGAIAVNRLGRRFVDESLSYKLIGDVCLAQPDAMGFQIFDQTVMDRSPSDESSFDAGAELRAGRLICAPTVSDLADRLGIDSQQLAATFARYNADALGGHDREFGRSSLCSGWGKLVVLERPPFYGYPTKSAVAGTYCGLVIDAATRVYDVFGEPIPGLFAAGQVTGGFHGVAYMTGTALSKAAVFGRIAAKAAAGETCSPDGAV